MLRCQSEIIADHCRCGRVNAGAGTLRRCQRDRGVQEPRGWAPPSALPNHGLERHGGEGCGSFA